MTIVNYDWDEDEDNIVEEYDDTGATVAEYTTEPEVFGNVISQRGNSQDSFYHYDGQGSTLALTDASGTVKDIYSYSAFGEVTAQTGSTVNPFKVVHTHNCCKPPGIAKVVATWRSGDKYNTATKTDCLQNKSLPRFSE